MPSYRELDAATRREVDRALGKKTSAGRVRKRARPSAAQAPSEGGQWRCECGETFTSWARAEAHPAGPGHTRMEVQMLGTSSPTGASTSHS